MRNFKLFRGYMEQSITERWLDIDWEEINGRMNRNITIPTLTPNWNQTYPYLPGINQGQPMWQVFPDTIRYNPQYGTNPNYTITTTPNNYGAVYTTLPLTGTATTTSLTTSTVGISTYTALNFTNTSLTNSLPSIDSLPLTGTITTGNIIATSGTSNYK